MSRSESVSRRPVDPFCLMHAPPPQAGSNDATGIFTGPVRVDFDASRPVDVNLPESATRRA